MAVGWARIARPRGARPALRAGRCDIDSLASSLIAAPTSPPPVTMLTTRSSTPPSRRRRPSRAVVPAASSEGLTTAVHPAARAKGSFWLTMSSGKFQGVMIATTPTGSWTTIARTSWPRWLWASPWEWRARVAAYSHRSAAVSTSSRAWVTGLPDSSVSIRASSSRSRRISSPVRCRTRARSTPARRGHGPSSNARRAAVTARSTSSTPARA